MRRRPSGSSAEEDGGISASPSQDGGKTSNTVARSLSAASKTSTDGNHVVSSTSFPRPTQAWTKNTSVAEKDMNDMALMSKSLDGGSAKGKDGQKRSKLRNPWSLSLWSLLAVTLACLLLATILRSFMTRQLDPKGCRMSYMRSSFVRYTDFDTEHTSFATKYNLYLYREIGIDDDTRVKGVPVLFIPGNAGSYKQVRSLASEAAFYYQNTFTAADQALAASKRPLDFFTVDFNEDITAFHGQTLLDQAEYLNDAIAYILSLYHSQQRSNRDPNLPDPSSVILVGHSMGGVVARTMLTMPNYQANTINTIITLSAPHARPPVSFDAQIVDTYKSINEYWRSSYSKQWGNENPLWHVTLISIAGGGLDTIVPSDYASVASIVPETHGFTVFTSTMPNVWTGMDHLAITWCDQLRKSVVHALYEIIDVNKPSQVRRRAERMSTFKKWFLTGLEDLAERKLQHVQPSIVLTLEDNSNTVLPQGERLVVRGFGHSEKSKAYLMPVPPQDTADGRKFVLLSDQHAGNLDVIFCSVFSHQAGQSAALFSMNTNLSADTTGQTRLVCKSAMPDLVTLPASKEGLNWPFDQTLPFSYFQYDLDSLSEHHFVAVVDKASSPQDGFVVAEFNSVGETIVRPNVDIGHLVSSGLQLRLPSTRPLTVDVKLPALHSSLLAYKLDITSQGCRGNNELFAPLLRQYVTDVYESRFFVNAKHADINLHGVAPYMPPSFRGTSPTNGLSFQLWNDPTCQTPLDLSLQVDILGSMGKLWMRYRTLFAALPLLVVALAMRKQFKVYDETGVFMSFSESMNQSLKRSLSIAVLGLVCLALLLAKATEEELIPVGSSTARYSNATESLIDYAKNDILLGTPDTVFWFLMPAFVLICFGICTLVNWAALVITFIFALVYGRLRSNPPNTDESRRTPAAFAVTSTRQRVITTGVLLVLVSTIIPYQFAYLVLCIVQIATCVRAWRLVLDTKSDANYNFYNYSHSMLILMLWILPINMPVLVVWIRNLAVHWLTPFSSHHNILSIMPYILLVETLSTGRMVPKMQTRLRHFTTTLFLILALWAAIFGVSYAYRLHHFTNAICLWLVLIHLSDSASSLKRVLRNFNSTHVDANGTEKQP